MADIMSFGEALERRIKTLPEFFQPIAYGAAVILLFMGARGALIMIPIAIVYVLLTSRTPLADLTNGAAFLLTAIAAGALAGLSYTLIGRYVKRVGTLGPYLAGIVTAAPYLWVIFHLDTNRKSHALFQAMDKVDYVFLAAFSIFFGSIIGVAFRKKKEPTRRNGEHAT